MFSARATLEVSQVSSGWLKLCAFAKVECMVVDRRVPSIQRLVETLCVCKGGVHVVTLDVSQLSSGWLKLCAFENID